MNEINGITYLYLTYGVMYGVVVHTHISPECSPIKKIDGTCLKLKLPILETSLFLNLNYFSIGSDIHSYKTRGRDKY